MQVPQEIAKPTNARELFLLRKFYDQTVWADERLAERYERWIVGLWNSLLGNNDKWEVLANVSAETLVIGTPQAVHELDWDIVRSQLKSPRKLTPEQWRSLAEELENAGYEIIETEWHHSEFIPPKPNQAPQSVVSMLMHVTHAKSNTRYIIRGDLKIEWSDKKAGETFLPRTIDASNLTILERKGTPAFREVFQQEFQLGEQSQLGAISIHPVMLFDLNNDRLPEVIIAGQNKVYWNRGNWQFDEGELCRFPARYVSAGALEDFNGDGHVDFLCGVQLGMPKLYLGDGEGKGFTAAPREIRISKNKLVLPDAITVGDIDHDGDLDVFIGQNKIGYQTGEIPDPYYDANDSFPSYLLINNGQGEFTDGTLFAGLGKKRNRRNFSSSFVDMNDDGHLDLLMTNDFCGNDLFLNDGTGAFRDVSETLIPRSISHGMSHTFGDYNLDGKLDFLTIGMSSTTARRLDKLQLGRPGLPEHNRQRKHMGYGNRLYLQEANDTYRQASFNASVARTGWSWGSTTLDFDRDGDPDVYVVNGQTSGKSTQDYCTQYWCHDLYHATEASTTAIKDFFSQVAPIFNGNFMSWNGYEHNALLMNLDGEDFVNVGFLMDCASEFDSRMAGSADLDLDGRVDLVFEHNSARDKKAHIHLLRNQFEDAHHWIGFHLESKHPNVSPIGAKVTVQTKNGVFVQHVITGHSVWAQHPNTLHFGLGKTDVIDSVVVTWPNGDTTKLEQPSPDQYHVVSFSP